MTPARSKYNSKKTTVDGIVFDSNVEARRYLHLVEQQKLGVISDLQLQPRFVLAPSVKFAGARARKPAMRYSADFSYLDERGVLVVEDVKSASTMTTSFTMRRHLLLSVHGIDLLITSSKDLPRAVRTTAKPKAKP